MVSLTALVLCVASTVGANDVTLLSFSADWCGQCKSMEPTIRRLQSAGYPVRHVNIDQERAVTNQLRVTGVPCFVLFGNGQVLDRVDGATSFDRLAQMFTTARFAPPNASPPTPSPQPPATIVRGQAPETRGGGFPGFGRLNSLFEKKNPPTNDANSRPTDAFAPGVISQPTDVPLKAELAAGSTAISNTGTNGAQRSLLATVRLKVEDPNGHSLGTGTIVDTHDDEALIVTCGHIFRDSKGQGKVHVDVFGPPGTRTVIGKVIDYDLKRDIGLVVIRPAGVVVTAKVAPTGFAPAKGDGVFSVGCDRGAQPTVNPSRITAINKYLGPPNIEVAGQPIDGRSGGGLFSADGQLIGVCNAADPADKEGIYAALATIHWQLAQVGQDRLFRRDDMLLTGAAGQPATSINNNAVRPASAQMEIPPALAVASAPGILSPKQIGFAAPLMQPVANVNAPLGDETEVICIVRTKNDPSGKSRVFFLDRIPVELQDRLLTEGSRGASVTNPLDLSSLKSASPRPLEPPPMFGPESALRDGVIRGQSN